MTGIAPAAAVAPLRWRRAAMETRGGWRLDAGDALLEDGARLERWAAGAADPVTSLRRDSTSLPAVAAIAAHIADALDSGGVAWVRGLGALPEPALRLLYLAIGLELGDSIDTYGRLYEVRDRGVSYRDTAAPVSQTREATGRHTDSSARDVCPRVVGLACVRPAPSGGRSHLVSAAEVHEQLRAAHPELLAALYGDFVRDIVTPSGDRSPARVRENTFPIFAYGQRLLFRYMRYWIERGHARAELPLGERPRAAFDALDAALTEDDNVLSVELAAGDLLFIDNTTIAHDRDAYEDDPGAPRLMLRLWLTRHADLAQR